MSPLLISKILELFVNTLTADDTYSLCNRENLQQAVKTQISKTQNILPNIWLHF